MGETVNYNVTINRDKDVGRTKLEDGSPDSFEAYSLSQDDMLGISPRNNAKIPRPTARSCRVFSITRMASSAIS